MGYAVEYADVVAAAERIQGVAHRTPVLTSRTMDGLSGARLFFKCENLQRVGAFKFRGAYNAIVQLPPDVKAVVTHSSGNHAQAVALASRLRGIEAHIVMPTSAPEVKRDAVVAYGARVIPCEPTLEARERTADAVMNDVGGVLIHPYDHPHVIAGAGTAALELLQEVDGLDVMTAPVGGGGLMSGTCVATRGFAGSGRSIALYGTEPEGADDAARSFAVGERIEQTAPNTVADGLLTSTGVLTWPILRDHLSGIYTVSDDQIRDAMRLVWQRMKIVIEPSSAVPVAAALAGRFSGRRVGVILTGGNAAFNRLCPGL